MGTRRQAREAALQILYLVDVCKMDQDEAAKAFWGDQHVPEKMLDFTTRLVHGITGKGSLIDELIVKYTENWELNRMAAIDRNIMRLASFELLEELETPVSVIINEAVEIAKKYSTPDSGKFVNGILDKVKNERPKRP